MKLKNLFTVFFILGIILLLSVGFFTYQILANRSIELQYQDTRFRLYLLAEELKQSSEDLTKFSRNYVTTLDSIWENKYRETLDVRNGIIPRPDGRKIAFRDSLKNLGITAEELGKFQEAEDYLNELTYTEQVAFNAVKGVFDDGSGEFSINGKPDPELAKRILFDKKYHADKEKIIHSIRELVQLIHKRTSGVVIEGNNSIYNLLYLTLGLILILIVVASVSFFIIKARIINHIEELDKAHTSIKSSEDKFRQLFELSPIGMILIDVKSGKFLEVNEAALHASGFSRNEFLDFTFKEMSPSENRNRIDIYFEHLSKEGKFGPAETELIHKDGSHYPIKLSAHKFKETSGREVIWGIIEDVTSLKLMERSLQLSHERFFIMLSNLLSGLLVATEEGRIEFVNQAFCNLFGLKYTPQELIGLSSSEVIDIIKDYYAEPEAAVERIRDILFNGEEVIGEEIKLKDGKICIRDFVPLYISNKRYGRLWNHQDVTEQKKSEMSLQYERTLLRTLIDHLPDLIYSKDKQARKTLANKADIISMGVKSEAEAIGKDDFAFYPNERAKEFIKEDFKVIETGEPATDIERWHYDEKGKIRWYSSCKYPLRNKEGEIIGLVGIGRDITEHKLKDIELQKQLQRQTSLINILQYEADSVKKFLDLALEEALKITESKIGYIYHYDEEKKEFKLNSWSKEVMSECMIPEPQTIYQLENTGFFGEVIRQRKEIIDNDFQSSRHLKKGYPEGHVIVHKYLALPLFKNDQIIAVIGVGNKEDDYNDTDVSQLYLLMRTVLEKVFSIEAQTALRESETRLKQAQLIAHVGHWEVDLLNSTIKASEESARIYGAVEDELSLKTVQNAALAEYRARLDEALKQLLFGQNVYDEIFQIKRINDGSIRWVHSKAELVCSHLGKPVRITGTIQDITDIKIAEEALERSEEQLKLVIQGSGVGAWDWQVQTTEVVFNERWAEICGYTLKELEPLGLNTWRNLAHPEDLKKSDELIQKHFKGKTDFYECEVRMKHKTGKWIWILDRGKVVEWDEEGYPIRMSGTHLDITDRKHAEAQLQKYAKELEQLNQTKDKFFSIIAHDLRNPFGLVINYAEYIKEKIENINDEELSEEVDAMYISAKRVYALLENLLEWAKIQNKDNKPNFTQFNITDVLESQVELYKDILKEKSIKVDYEVDVTISVTADKNQIETVIRNLISNAVKFTEPEGEIKLKVFIDDADKKLPVKIIVADNGIGMNKDEVKNLFKMGNAATKIGTAGEKGTGLGLRLSREFIEMNGGNITVESKQGRGTTFVVSLPQSAQKL